jgi:hypothetical protein
MKRRNESMGGSPAARRRNACMRKKEQMDEGG